MAEAIEALQPKFVVIENVRGLLQPAQMRGI
jgi:site-specific DNA-cytosine methylase